MQGEFEAGRTLRQLKKRFATHGFIVPNTEDAQFCYIPAEHPLVKELQPGEDQLVVETIRYYRIPNSVALSTAQKKTDDEQNILVATPTETESVQDEWEAKYSQYNAQNLETRNVLQVSHGTFSFVHMGHPIIALLRANSAMLSCDIDTHPKIDNEWYKISNQVIAVAAATLRTKVLAAVDTMRYYRIPNSVALSTAQKKTEEQNIATQKRKAEPDARKIKRGKAV